MTKMMLPPTPRQRQAERFIEQYVHEHDGCSPSNGEIAKALGMTAQGANSVVNGLVDRGRAIRGRPWQPRTIRLLKEGEVA